MKTTSPLLTACLLAIGLAGTLPRLVYAEEAAPPASANTLTLSVPTLSFLAALAAARAVPADQPPPMGFPFVPPDAMRLASLHLPPFLHGIVLTEAQQDRVFAILHEQMPRLRDQEKALHKAHELLRGLSIAPVFDEAAAREASKAEARASAELHLLMARTDSRLLALLTAQQRQQISLSAPHRPDRPGHHGQPERLPCGPREEG